jgi:hypothetical protein
MRRIHLPGRQRGELNLFWCVVLFAALGFAVFAGLVSFRDGRNLFAEWWDSARTQAAGVSSGKIPSAITTLPAAGAPASSEIRKCIVNGKVVYSNVECGADNATSRKLDASRPGAVSQGK